jgi:Zn ribbon nucleic-acid-binding protein
MMNQDGTMTGIGYCWKCTDCNGMFFIASDNIVLTKCPECGGDMKNAPKEEADRAAADILASNYVPTSRSTIHGECKKKKSMGSDKILQ